MTEQAANKGKLVCVPLLTVTFGLITAPPVSLTTTLIASPRRDITP